jgi:hypothetical protein
LILTGKVIHTVWGSGREPVNLFHEGAGRLKTGDGRQEIEDRRPNTENSMKNRSIFSKTGNYLNFRRIKAFEIGTPQNL